MCKPMVVNLSLAGCPTRTPSRRGDTPPPTDTPRSPRKAESSALISNCLKDSRGGRHEIHSEPVFELPPGPRPRPAYRARLTKPSFLLTLLERILQQETRCHKTEKSPVRGHHRFHSCTRALSLHWFPITSWPPLTPSPIPTRGHPRT